MERTDKNVYKFVVFGLFYLIIGIGAVPSLCANTVTNFEGSSISGFNKDAVTASTSSLTQNAVASAAKQVILNSRSFTAGQRSSFSIGGRTEEVERGLTVVHFQTADRFEFRTFDTHASEEATTKLIEVLGQLRKNKAVFALLAHDSAAKSLTKQGAALSTMGFSQLSTLKNRQAYVMHNFKEGIFEKIDDLSLSETIDLPTNLQDEKVYFPKVKYEFEPNNDRYIAHAGGEVDGIKSTNTKQALDQNYARGFRLFELDIIETSDGKLVAAHDWGMWSRFTEYGGTLPPTHAEFKKHNIYGDYTTLDMEGINAWFLAHPDATLVTDKVNDPIAFAGRFVDKDRLIMELFSLMAVEDASLNGIESMMSQGPLLGIKGDKLNYLLVNNIRYVAVSRRIIASQTELLLQLRDARIKVYVYNVNFDAGKDEKYVQENEIGLVYGMYADQWAFDFVPKLSSK